MGRKRGKPDKKITEWHWLCAPRKLITRLSKDLPEASQLLRHLLGLLEAVNSFPKKKKRKAGRDHRRRAKLADHKHDLCL